MPWGRVGEAALIGGALWLVVFFMKEFTKKLWSQFVCSLGRQHGSLPLAEGKQSLAGPEQ
jgi:hypothetical protein